MQKRGFREDVGFRAVGLVGVEFSARCIFRGSFDKDSESDFSTKAMAAYNAQRTE
jgi:hypothetical protein